MKVSNKFLNFIILLIVFINQSNLVAQADNLNLQLIKATKKRNINQIKELIERGADVNVTDKYGVTPLIRATIGHHLDLVEYLIARGANVDAQQIYGTTALMWAAHWGIKDIAKVLIQAGANVNILDDRGERALDAVGDMGYDPGLSEILSLEEDISKGQTLKNIDKLESIEDIIWYLKRTLKQLETGNTQIYNLLPEEYKIVLDVYKQLMAGALDRNQIEERLEDLVKFYPKLKPGTNAHQILKSSLAAIYIISNKVHGIPIATNIFLMSDLNLEKTESLLLSIIRDIGKEAIPLVVITAICGLLKIIQNLHN